MTMAFRTSNEKVYFILLLQWKTEKMMKKMIGKIQKKSHLHGNGMNLSIMRPT